MKKMHASGQLPVMKKKTILLFFISVAGLFLLALAGSAILKTAGAPPVPFLPPAKDEYSRLMKNYFTDSVLYSSGTIKLFDGSNMNIVKEESGFVFYKEGNNYYSQLSSQQNFSDGVRIIQLDTVNHILLVTNQKDGNLASANTFLSLDHLFSDTASPGLSGEVFENGNYRDLILHGGFSPGIKQYTITYDPKNYIIRETTIEWIKDVNSGDSSIHNEWVAKVSVDAPSKRTIDISSLMKKIIEINNNNVVPAAAYSSYRFHFIN